jgi:hypothetical protein
MNPIVLIATHERQEITLQNIRTLKEQSLVPKIVLVTSCEEEFLFYSQVPDIFVLHSLNEPLGSKWQAGVDFSRTLKPDPLIITGSDDILARDFISLATDFVSAGGDFLGLQQWYILDPRIQHLFLFQYTPEQPLGGGRVYSATFLEKINYQLFDTSAKKWLDDHGWNLAQSQNKRICQAPYILAVKGRWPVMNPLQKTLRHRNAKLLKKWVGPEVQRITRERFNYPQ